MLWIANDRDEHRYSDKERGREGAGRTNLACHSLGQYCLLKNALSQVCQGVALRYIPSSIAFRIEDFPDPVAPQTAMSVVGEPCFSSLVIASQVKTRVRRQGCNWNSRVDFAKPDILAHLIPVVDCLDAFFDSSDLDR